MRTADITGSEYVKEATGEPTVYPGHPLVVAFEIINVFGSPEEAFKPVESDSLNCPTAVADNRVSGGGGEVYAACELLQRARKGHPVEELIAWADMRWSSGQAGGHVKAVAPGLQQANKLKSVFSEKLAAWLSQQESI